MNAALGLAQAVSLCNLLNGPNATYFIHSRGMSPNSFDWLAQLDKLAQT